MVGLENVRVLLGEPNVQVRRTVADSLRHHGYHSIRDTSQVEQIYEAVNEDQIDVLICDVELGGLDLCDLIYRVRHHQAGNNPFLVTIALVANPTSDNIHKIVNSGSDDLLLKPVSVGQIIERLNILTKKRKGFVVTTDYIGPDRRKNGHRPGTVEIPVIEVPNPLRYKQQDGADLMQMQAEVHAAAQLINDHKMERHAHQIDYLVKNIVPQYAIGDVGSELTAMVARLSYVAEDLVRRMADTKREHILHLGEAMIKVSSSIHKTPLSPSLKDVHLLPQLSAAISQAFVADEQAIELAGDIAASVGRGVPGA
ncbi:MAG: response regulator [Magnetovibrio sp.]|nr:response regulator [Magnetovibrio sp.]